MYKKKKENVSHRHIMNMSFYKLESVGKLIEEAVAVAVPRCILFRSFLHPHESHMIEGSRPDPSSRPLDMGAVKRPTYLGALPLL